MQPGYQGGGIAAAHRDEQGINFFDHADIYGKGGSESLFASALGMAPSLRGQIVIQTKCAIHDGMYDFSKEHILKSVECSLRRLQTDYIDILLLHRPDTLMEPEEVAEAFAALRQSGKVRYFGVSNQNAAQMALLQSALRRKAAGLISYNSAWRTRGSSTRGSM